MADVALRPVDESDLDALFEQARDLESIRMAAFVGRDPDDRAAFDVHMAKVRASPEVIIRRTHCRSRCGPRRWPRRDGRC